MNTSLRIAVFTTLGRIDMQGALVGCSHGYHPGHPSRGDYGDSRHHLQRP